MSLAIRHGKARGDPGLFGFLGKAVGGIAKIGTSLLPGPIGAVARTALGALGVNGGRAMPTMGALPTPPPTRMPPLPPGFDMAATGASGWKPTVNGGRGILAQPQVPQPTQFMADVTPAIGCPKGFKPNKSAYYRRVYTPGNPEGILVHVAPGSRCVRIRKRNPANPRAADRAIGRIESAKRFSKRMSRVTIRKKCDCN